MITLVNKYYFQDPSIEWGYHMNQNSRLLLEWNFDYTASYLILHKISLLIKVFIKLH